MPGLAVVLVGNNPASEVYVGSKKKMTVEAGMKSFDHHLPETVSEAELLALIAKLNADPAVNGILVQLPLPEQIDAQKVINAIDPGKDVDGFHPLNAGRLATGPAGAGALHAAWLHHSGEVRAAIAGRPGRGRGRPLQHRRQAAGALLIAESATVTVAHSKTADLPAVCRRGDLLFAAVGRAEMIKGDWVKPGATVIDVGINRVPGATPGKTRIVGDVDYAEAAAQRGRDHAGSRRCRPDDHCVPAGQYAARRLRGARSAGADGLNNQVRRI